MAYVYAPPTIPRYAAAITPVGDDATTCPSCLEGYGIAFLIGGLLSAVVILAAAPAARLHKEYTK